MNAVRLHRRGGPEALVYEEVPSPRPGKGEVLVRVHAAAVTPSEFAWDPTWVLQTGEPRPFPIIMGHEFSGEVRACGAGVTDFAEGDTVFGMNDWFGDGAQAEYCLARPADIAWKPSSIDHVHAAITPISALTAWQGLFVRAQLSKGERVLIHGAAGSVGTFAVQLARSRGAHVIGTVSPHNLDFVRGLGADEVIDYRAERFESVVRDVDVVFDTVGGDTLARSWSLLRPAGRMVTIAASSEQIAEPRAREAFFIVEPDRPQLEEVAHLIDNNELQVTLGGVFPIAYARQAYEYKPERGKVALELEI
jgi:NADPH:quinone reductase-like Zn-dependent oxidoreductase